MFVLHPIPGEKRVWIPRTLHTKAPENKRLCEQQWEKGKAKVGLGTHRRASALGS